MGMIKKWNDQFLNEKQLDFCKLYLFDFAFGYNFTNLVFLPFNLI